MRDEKQKLEAALKTVSHGTMGQIHEGGFHGLPRC